MGESTLPSKYPLRIMPIGYVPVEVSRREGFELHEHLHFCCHLQTLSDLSHSPSVSRIIVTNEGGTGRHIWKERTACRTLLVKPELKTKVCMV